ncbi:MAG TPA: chemotaxis protein CheW [Gallionellaceae bacterium]|nr:chemotaxis protein CheW [Gallionellaceae bacterium]
MSKRFNLREFQQGLLDRMQVQAEGGSQVATLGIIIGQDSWLVEMSDISEVMSLPELTAVPLTKHWYCGVANVRGNIYSIIDLGAYINYGLTAYDAQSRVLLIGQKYNFNTGLLVSKVLGLRNIKDWQHSEQDGVVSYQDDTGQQWRKLDIRQLIQQPEFIQIGV